MRFRIILISSFLLLSGACLILSYYALKPATVEQLASHVETNLNQELSKVDVDFDLIMKSDGIASDYDFSYPVFLYDRGRLIFWSDNKFVPPYQLADSSEVRLYRTASDAYLLKKRVLGSGREIVAAIKLARDFPISNDYLTREVNRNVFPTDNFLIFEKGATAGAEVCINSTCLFRLVPTSERVSGSFTIRIITVLLWALWLVAMFVLIATVTVRLSHRIKFLIWLTVIVTVRLVMMTVGFPANLVDHQLFDPQVFASSALNRSLGDLFLNLLAVFGLSLLVFVHYFRFKFNLGSGRFTSLLSGVVAALFLLFAMLFPVIVVQTLYNNSSIILDISQSLRFDSLRIVSIVCVIISGVCAFFFSHVAIRILMKTGGIAKISISLLIAALLFFLINENTGQQYLASLLVAVGYLYLVYFTNSARTLKRLTFESFAYLFLWILFLSANCAYAIQYFTHKERIENQFRFADNFLIDRDLFAEYLLDEAAQKIASDAFIQTRITNPFLGKDVIRQKIRQVFLPTYFNKYDVDIYIFNGIGESIDNGVVRLADLLRYYDQDAYRTNYERVFFVDNPDGEIAQEYLVRIPIQRASVLGYIIVKLSLKRIIPQSVYPELLVDYRFQQFYRTPDLSYAVISNSKFLFSSGDFNYERFFDRTWLGNTKLYTVGIKDEGYEHIAVEDQSGKIAIVSMPDIPFIDRVANFSFCLVLGLLIILVLIFVQGFYQYVRGERLFFSARIQLYLNLAFFIPLIIVSVTTLSLTSKSSQSQLNDQYLNRSKWFSQQLVSFIDEKNNEATINSTSISTRLTELATLSDIDANLYNPWGRLVVSSQPLIFESNLLSIYLNREAYERVLNGETSFIGSERVGKLEYYVAYGVLKSSQTGKLFGIIALPFFQSAYSLEKIQTEMLINILNIFAFILIVLLFLSYFVADRLTFPLRFITNSLKRTSLTQNNVPLSWSTDDEIGLMVKEYNSMLYKLGESKSELEQTQREKAWREIAQQVAHEIKNPLTPMKLTLQQLERAVQSGNNSAEKVSKSIRTLLEQVDTLNEIASSFSGFAKMPEPVIQKVEIVSLVRKVVDLHSPTGDIEFKTTAREVIVNADEQLLSRTVSNLVLNGLQSGIPGQVTSVKVSVSLDRDDVLVSIKDNGKGIGPEIAERIFTPHFSTKKSGSGLGLAIARQAIEHMRGKIWFDSQVGKGTTFYIQLPVA